MSAAAQGPPVQLTISDGLGVITLARGDKSNAIDEALAAALLEAVSACADPDSGVRAVLLRGDGPHFCAGGQVADLLVEPAAAAALADRLVTRLNAAVQMLVELPVPVVAAVQGFAVGGGLGLVCAADVVVAGASARFISGFTRIGLAPDCGVSATLAPIVGRGLARDMVLTNRVIDAAEAQRVGLVSRVVADGDLAETAQTLASGLARGPAQALAESKRMLRDSGASLPERLDDEAATLSRLCRSADAREGIDAQFSRRPPEFTGSAG
ncbi:enoyl-CoA hydratase PaaB [Gordonia hirsuta DSM 44140 = NBRC 16056]|uniref:Enoyl-CoA hydratase PaaB n=1 Tax=Gordonia hirsuta DSM 44140 = NBRC 16056 TaxID=1121927 RepID=L7LE04_9ACTN|nr:enoyl-CoA hydratase-related protein [Gordonia hirsuta]GAC58283.1 enoyl-CoA hydratase PaaB [Gordonia hirsuta DSM 44140 = NBRC 16056]